jgi:glycosyltransferase involved in cell wall biosynthesis
VIFNWRDLLHPEGGGSELYVEHVAAGLAARGHRVTLFCAAHDNAPADETRGRVRIVRRGNRLSVYLHAALHHVTGRFGAHDVVVDVQNGMPFLSRLYTRRSVVVLVHHVHREQWPVVFGPKAAQLGWWVESRLAPRVYRSARYVAVSEVTRTELVALGVRADAISVIRNGTAPAPSTVTSRSTTPALCVLGRLVPHKRVEIAIEALAQLSRHVPDLTLDIVGHGYWDERLRARAAELGVADRVTFHGFVDEQTKHEILARSWVLAVPSLKEGWGLSVMEAALQHVPAVAFRSSGGLTESIADGVTGVLADDTAGFTAAVHNLLVDRSARERLGAAAAARAQTFTWQATADAFAAVVDDAAAGRGRR